MNFVQHMQWFSDISLSLYGCIFLQDLVGRQRNEQNNLDLSVFALCIDVGLGADANERQ